MRATVLAEYGVWKVRDSLGVGDIETMHTRPRPQSASAPDDYLGSVGVAICEGKVCSSGREIERYGGVYSRGCAGNHSGGIGRPKFFLREGSTRF
ncbi:hypothetical protein PI247_30600 (plasmid) [Rhodococcus qingshengii]|nr:hypothetical protein [Rhodococcus qingshengii]WCT05824.1 hypothetical protein PI247_30600 [Rhodococcus qingshengii]